MQIVKAIVFDQNCFDNTKIYNNTLVDNKYNFRFWNPDSDDSIEIMNNISWTITGWTPMQLIIVLRVLPGFITCLMRLFRKCCN